MWIRHIKMTSSCIVLALIILLSGVLSIIVYGNYRKLLPKGDITLAYRQIQSDIYGG